jgi:hypothetical protein
MNDNEMDNVIMTLKDMTWGDQYEKLENYSFDTLEKLAVHFQRYKSEKERNVFELNRRILTTRCGKLMNEFVWTDEKIERLLKVNDQLQAMFEKSYNYAMDIAGELEKKLQNNDQFVKNYEIKIEVMPYICPENDDDEWDTIESILSEPDCHPIHYRIDHAIFDRIVNTHDELPIYLKKSLNWNTKYFDDRFKDYYIGYSIHALLDAHEWSFQDILRIGTIWSEVIVRYQTFIENI